MKQCSGCHHADWHTESASKTGKDDRIYIGGLFEPKKQLLARQPQSPVFVIKGSDPVIEVKPRTRFRSINSKDKAI